MFVFMQTVVWLFINLNSSTSLILYFIKFIFSSSSSKCLENKSVFYHTFDFSPLQISLHDYLSVKFLNISSVLLINKNKESSFNLIKEVL